MTVSSQINKSGPYPENGVTTEFAYEFRITDETHIKVVRATSGVETILALGADYTVTGVNGTGGDVVVNVPGVGSTLTLVRDVPLTQGLELENQGPYFSKDVEKSLDLSVMRDQQLQEQIDRAVKVPVSSAIDPAQLIASLQQSAVDATNAAGAAAASAGAADGSADAAAASAGSASSSAASASEDAAVAAAARAVVEPIADDIATVAANIIDIQNAEENANIATAKAAEALASAAAAAAAAGSLDIANLRWLAKGVGELYAVDTSIAGVDVPPTGNAQFRYVKLTASDAYNTGVLISESVSGSAPNVTATAVVSLAGSPLNGKTLALINTDRRFLRAGGAGTKEQSDNLSHTHTGTAASAGAHTHPSVEGVGSVPINSGTGQAVGAGNTGSAGAHTHTLTINANGGTEARPANLGVTYYMRIK